MVVCPHVCILVCLYACRLVCSGALWSSGMTHGQSQAFPSSSALLRRSSWSKSGAVPPGSCAAGPVPFARAQHVVTVRRCPAASCTLLRCQMSKLDMSSLCGGFVQGCRLDVQWHTQLPHMYAAACMLVCVQTTVGQRISPTIQARICHSCMPLTAD